MAKKSGVKSEEITKAFNRIKNAEKKRDDADKKYGYSRCLDEYNGDYANSIPSFVAGVDLIPINEVYAYAKTFVPSVYSRDPYITINPKGKKFIVGAKILEYAVNAYWRELQLKRQIKKSVFNAIFAEGYIKLGYSSSLGSIAKEDGEKSIAPSEFISEDEIFAINVSWKNIVRDPDSTDDLYDARFVAHQIILPTDAIKASSMYDNTEDLNPNFAVKSISPGKTNYGEQYGNVENYSVLYEVWDRDMEMVYTISEGCDKYLMYKKWPYKFSGAKQSYPFEMIRFNEAPDACYGPNLIAPWEPQLWEKMKMRAIQLDHIKRFGRQLITEKGALSRQEMDKLKKGITGSIIQAEPGKGGTVQPIQYPPIQPDIYAIENRIDLDKDNISGQPNVVRSAPQKTSSRTLGEVDRLISAFQSRQNDPQSVVEEFSERVSKKLIGLMQQYFSENKYLNVGARDAKWLAREIKDNPPDPSAAQDMSGRVDDIGFLMKPEDIKKIEFEVEVRAGSTLPLDRKNRTSAMVNIVELGDKIGIQPGSKTSKVIGKNLVAEFDMPEIVAAYEDDMRKMDVNEKVAQIGAVAKAQLIKEHAGRLGKLHHQATGGTPPPQSPPAVPPELIS